MYETDEAYEEGTERMQLNPSTDFYEDYEDDEEYNDEAVELDGEDEAEGSERVSESLPEAKSLVQLAPGAADDEEDMGYDEDDERIAIAVERPGGIKSQRKDKDKDKDVDEEFMNEEGSGVGTGAGGRYERTRTRTAFDRYKNNKYNENRFRVDQLDKYHRKKQKITGEGDDEAANRESGVEPRESSGNFANDDEDDADDDYDSEENDEHRDGFFQTNRKSSGGRYFRKNTNDAIKIISTPLGKVGIVYQQTPTQEEEEQKKREENAQKKAATSFTDFDALSPDPESSHRLASSHPKITPVLTPDGKVALLYRGDSESSKYEPIRNLTHTKFSNNNKNEPTDNKASATNTKTTKKLLDTQDTDNDSDNENENESDSSSDLDISDDTGGDGEKKDQQNIDVQAAVKEGGVEGEMPKFAEVDPAKTDSSGSFIIRPTDSVLPMINRPLSEVLGIKKNQFKQFRIKDTPTTTTSPATTDAIPRSLAGAPHFETGAGSTTLHFLTKVNLAEYPTLNSRTRNRDFDFSRDNTMLDERARHKEQQLGGEQENGQTGVTVHSDNPLANEEILAKTEVVNLAIIPHFDEELERLQRLREHESRRHHRQRHRHKQQPTEEDLSGIHCIMQAMMGVAAISTVFGMLGTFFKQRILDQLRLMHW